jgi:hypothetical protein
MPNSATPKHALSSPAGPLPTAAKGARFRLSAGAAKNGLKMLTAIEFSGTEEALF